MELEEYLNQKTELFRSLLQASQQMARVSGSGSVEALLEAQERRNRIIGRIGKLDEAIGDLPETLPAGATEIASRLKDLVKQIADVNEGMKVNVALRKQEMDSESRQAAVARKYTRTGAL